MPGRERGERDEERVDHREHDRERRRRSRSRDRSDRRRRSRSRSRSRSPSHKRRRSSPGPNTTTSGPSGRHEEPPMSALTQEERMMKEMMGFGSFHTTKGKKVAGNNVGAVHVIMKRKYRQYMNRKGGFNRPLDFVA